MMEEADVTGTLQLSPTKGGLSSKARYDGTEAWMAKLSRTVDFIPTGGG